MLREKQKNSTHQQFSFGNSKLIFLFDEQPKQSRPKTQHSRLRNQYKSKKIENGSTLELNCKQNLPPTNTRDARSTSKIYTSEVTKRSEQAKQIKYGKISNQNISLIKNKSHVNTSQQTPRAKANNNYFQEHKSNRVQELSNDQKDSLNCLSIQSIKMLVGVHHYLYDQRFDYLSKIASQSALRQKSWRNGPIKNNQKCNSNGYRAPILDFFVRSSSRAKDQYIQLVSSNYSSNTYIDNQFPPKNFPTPKNDSITWSHIPATPNLNLFPSNPTNFNPNPNPKQIPFIDFINFLYTQHPNLFIRLMQPPIGNVYSFWLYFDGAFRPVIVDCYFAVGGDREFYFTGNLELMWGDVLVKCICKVYRTYDIQFLRKIQIQQVYRLLTGSFLNSLTNKCLSLPDQKLLNFLIKQTYKQRFIFVKQDNQFKVLNQSSYKNFSYRWDLKIFSLQIPKNMYIYQLSIFSGLITKFQIKCQKKTEIVFGLPQFKEKLFSKVYIYRCIQADKIMQVTKIQLLYQIDVNSSPRVRLKQGSYKIFFEDRQNLVKQIFTKKLQSKKNSNQMEKCYKMSLISSEYVLVNREERLTKNKDFIEDSQNIYEISQRKKL